MLVDSSVLIDVFVDDATWANWSVSQMRQQAQVHSLFINPIVYAEVSLVFDSISLFDRALSDLEVSLRELPRPSLFLAARAFVQYKKDGGTRSSVLPDFFIGAHAAVSDVPVLTRDPSRIRRHFPTVEIIAPSP
jgi:predicted nucleic acid-binding protein